MINNTELLKRIESLEKGMKDYASLSQFGLLENIIDSKLKLQAEVLNKIQEKLTIINLPEETKYYLQVNEIEDFRSKYKTLIVLVEQLEDLYQNVIAYVAQLKK